MAAVIGVPSLVVLVLLLVLVICLYKRCRERPAEPEWTRQDDNPVYGLYEFADGSNIDDNSAEVEDTNDYYG